MPICWCSANSALDRISDKNWYSITLFFIRIEMAHATLLISVDILPRLKAGDSYCAQARH